MHKTAIWHESPKLKAFTNHSSVSPAPTQSLYDYTRNHMRVGKDTRSKFNQSKKEVSSKHSNTGNEDLVHVVASPDDLILRGSFNKSPQIASTPDRKGKVNLNIPLN